MLSRPLSRTSGDLRGKLVPVSDPESMLITGIGELVTNDGDAGAFAALTDAALVIEAGQVAWTGPASRAPAAGTVLDAAGRLKRSTAGSSMARAVPCAMSQRAPSE